MATVIVAVDLTYRLIRFEQWTAILSAEQRDTFYGISLDKYCLYSFVYIPLTPATANMCWYIVTRERVDSADTQMRGAMCYCTGRTFRATHAFCWKYLYISAGDEICNKEPVYM